MSVQTQAPETTVDRPAVQFSGQATVEANDLNVYYDNFHAVQNL
jgi:hypothetical protein